MTDSLTIALAQLNPTVGDIDGNVVRIRAARLAAGAGGADLVIGTELCVSGYPPEDLVLKDAFLAAVRADLERGVDPVRQQPRCDQQQVDEAGRIEQDVDHGAAAGRHDARGRLDRQDL